jgi:hypothetical protein
MSDIRTLDGITEATNELYNAVKTGDIPEGRANVLTRILRGQTYISGDLRLKYLKALSAFKGSNAEKQIIDAVTDLHRFMAPKALEG